MKRKEKKILTYNFFLVLFINTSRLLGLFMIIRPLHFSCMRLFSIQDRMESFSYAYILPLQILGEARLDVLHIYIYIYIYFPWFLTPQKMKLPDLGANVWMWCRGRWKHPQKKASSKESSGLLGTFISSRFHFNLHA